MEKKTPEGDKAAAALQKLEEDRRVLYTNVKTCVQELKDLNYERIGGRSPTTSPKPLSLNREKLQAVLASGGSQGGLRTVHEYSTPEMDSMQTRINDMNKKIDNGLTILIEGVRRLRFHAETISSALDESNKKLQGVDTSMSNVQQSVQSVNKRLDTIIRELDSTNTCLTWSCCVLLLAMIGYVIYFVNGEPR
eukprot:PhF_6_TR44453/c0_g1_i1/m.68427